MSNIRDAYYDNADAAFAARFGGAGIGWHFEVGVHVMHLIFAGVLDRYPNLQVIMGHWGELIPYYMDRINTFFPATASPMKHDFKYYMQNNSVLPDGKFRIFNVSHWQSYDSFIHANNQPVYSSQLTTDLGQTPSVKLNRGFYLRWLLTLISTKICQNNKSKLKVYSLFFILLHIYEDSYC